MSFVVPSQAIAVIDRMFPSLSTLPPFQNFPIEITFSEHVSVILGVVEEIPSELIMLEGEKLAEFTAGLATLKNAQLMWPSHGSAFIVGGVVPGFGEERGNAISLLRDALSKCPDAAPIKGTTELSFIPDLALRENLRLDLSTAHTALRNNEWKPATVLAGSVIEALLLWALQQKTPTDVSSSIARLQTSGTLTKNPGADLLRWALEPFIAVAQDLNLISDGTARQCQIARDFRNLIHPGRAERLNIRCTRGTAHTAIGAMEQVIEDLS